MSNTLTVQEIEGEEPTAQTERQHQDYSPNHLKNLLSHAALQVTEFRVREEIYHEFASSTMQRLELEAQYREKIRNSNYEIGILKEKLQAFKNELQELEIQIRERYFYYEKLNEKFHQEVYATESLMRKHSSSETYNHDLRDKKSTLEQLESEIVQIELDLLYTEKDRIEKTREMQPLEDELEVLQLRLVYLKNEQNRKQQLGDYRRLNRQATEDNLLLERVE